MHPSPRRLAGILLAFAGLLVASCGQLDRIIENLPTLKQSDLRFKPPQTSKIYAGDGTLITMLHREQNRTVVPLGRIPKRVERAIIAIEDERFYEHDGIDFRAIVRAFLTNVESGEVKEGGSTITQQYVKNVIISPGESAEKSLERKIREAALARQLEEKLNKREILFRYLNTVYFGQGAYGIQAAAKTFFGKPVHLLSLREAALLAGMIRSPVSYDPYSRPSQAKDRRNLVLAKMADLGWAGEAEVRAATSKGLGVASPDERARYPAPYFVDYVQRLIKFDPRFKMFGRTWKEREKRLLTGGYRIHTTVDLNMQAVAEQAVDQVLTYESDPHGSLVAIEPSTGYVRAMVGGREYFAKRKEDKFAKLNLAIQAEPGLGRVKDRDTGKVVHKAPGTGRQAGSAFKPFALAEALRQGIPLSESYEAQACMDFPIATGSWRVCNYAESDFGPNMSLLEGTVNSVNVVYAQVIIEVGPTAVVELAKRMGISTPLLPYESSVLGANEVNPLGMASAFGTFATNGIHHPPIAITKIVAPDGRVVYEDESKGAQALEPAIAYMTTTALEQVIQRGTGATYGNIFRPAAGKTGTAQEYRDAWFVGYTPELVAAVWVGYPEGQLEMKAYCAPDDVACRDTRIDVTGGSWPTQIWSLFMQRALAAVPATDFQVPEGLVPIEIDTRTGCRASISTPDEYRSTTYFQIGDEPTCTAPIIRPEPEPTKKPPKEEKPKPDETPPGDGGNGNGNGGGNGNGNGGGGGGGD
jgi:penicillin-binding protein 1A